MAKWIIVLLALAAIACSDDDGPAQDSGLPPDDTTQREDGLTPDGKVTEDGPLSPDGAGPEIEWCTLQWPPSAIIAAGESLTAYGQVFLPAVTDTDGAGAAIEGELGHGPVGTDGSLDSGWTWTAASYNLDVSANDEYMADIAPAEGTYAYAYRFRYQGGPWLYCDLDGSTNGFDPAQQGSLTVDPVKPPVVDWCNIQFPPTGTVTEGTPLTVSGQVLVTGVTDAAGQGAQIEGELGYGPAGTDGSSSASWTWTAAAYNVDVGNNDEYMADLAPMEGSYAYAYRFRYQGGAWLYCDLDGSTNGYDAAQQGSLTVDPVQAPAVDWCNIQSPPTGTVTEGASFSVYGQVFVAGVTDTAGQGVQMEGELGYGPVGTDGSSSGSWTWMAAAYNVDVGNNDEYMADLTPAVGTHAYAYRFRYQGGPWLYCDLDGSTNGYDIAQQGLLTVNPAR